MKKLIRALCFMVLLVAAASLVGLLLSSPGCIDPDEALPHYQKHQPE